MTDAVTCWRSTAPTAPRHAAGALQTKLSLGAVPPQLRGFSHRRGGGDSEGIIQGNPTI
jgi:hypothetical protein